MTVLRPQRCALLLNLRVLRLVLGGMLGAGCVSWRWWISLSSFSLLFVEFAFARSELEVKLVQDGLKLIKVSALLQVVESYVQRVSFSANQAAVSILAS